MFRKVMFTALFVSGIATPSLHALQADELLELIAMPLAVAAVAEMVEVPARDLADVVALLNRADVPPAQFVEVVRYVPVAFVAEQQSATFVHYVRTSVDSGIRGSALVNTIEQRIRTYGFPDLELDVVAPRVVTFDRMVPDVVITRVGELKRHPHGGPPGQLKKVAGVQTGAEIVHGEKPGKGKVRKQEVTGVEIDRGGSGRSPSRDAAPPGHAQGGDKGKGKGKGKG